MAVLKSWLRQCELHAKGSQQTVMCGVNKVFYLYVWQVEKVVCLTGAGSWPKHGDVLPSNLTLVDSSRLSSALLLEIPVECSLS